MVELNVLDDFQGDDGCHCNVEYKAKRRPPIGIGDLLSAMVPEILSTVSKQARNEQPR